jgi:hypothetical protein
LQDAAKARKESENYRFGNPINANTNHFASPGPQSEPANQARVFLVSAMIIAVAYGLYSLAKLTRSETPGTLTKEWKVLIFLCAFRQKQN